MIEAEVIDQNNKNAKVSMVGQIVKVLRTAPNKKAWIKTKDGREMVWRLSHLKIIKKEG